MVATMNSRPLALAPMVLGGLVALAVAPRLGVLVSAPLGAGGRIADGSSRRGRRGNACSFGSFETTFFVARRSR